MYPSVNPINHGPILKNIINLFIKFMFNILPCMCWEIYKAMKDFTGIGVSIKSYKHFMNFKLKL